MADTIYGTPFVSRESERAMIAARLADAGAGRGGIVLLAGEPGIGKTRLAVEEAATAAAAGWRVLWGRCYEGDGALAYWPWTQILRSLFATEDSDVAEDDAAALALLVPELRDRHPTLRRPPATVTAQERFRTFESVTRVLTRDRSQMLLILDDLHWADVSSLLLLQFLAREVRDTATVLIGTYRDEEAGEGHPLRRTLGELVRLPHVSRHHLGGLGDVDVVRLVSAMIGAAAGEGVAPAVVRRAGGNPFFAGELVRLAVSDPHAGARASSVDGGSRHQEPDPLVVPVGVRDVVARRLERLSPACQQTVSAAAVIGQEFSLGILQRIVSQHVDVLLDALDEAAAAHMIVPRGPYSDYDFTHALVRETLYTNLKASQRLRFHHAAAEALRAQYEPAAESHLGEIAHHFLRAAAGGDAEMAVTYSRRAGEYALSHLGYEEAAGHFERAIRAQELLVERSAGLRGELYLALGDARMRAGETAAAQEAFLEAAAIACGLGAADGEAGHADAATLLGRAALGFGRVGIETGLVNERLVGLIESALAAQGGAENDLQVRLVGRLAMELYYSGQRERRAALSAEALSMARRLGRPDTLAFALHARHFSLWEPENLEERLALGAELPGAAEAAGDPEMQLQGLLLSVPDLLEVGEIEAVRRSIDAFVERSGKLRQPLYLWHATRLRALRAYLDGRLDAMERLADEALAIAVRAGINGADVLHVSHLQFLRREQGRYEEVEASIVEIMSRYPRLADSWRLTLANVYAQTGRTIEARRALAALAGSEIAATGRELFTIAVTALLTEAVVAIGDEQRAAALYERLLPYARRGIVNGATPNFYGPASYYLGCLAGTLGRTDVAIEHLQAALTMNRRIGVRPLIARTEHALAAALTSRGDREDRARAAILAEQAHGTANDLGMARTAKDAEALIAWLTAKSGMGVATPQVSAPFGELTARQVEVLRLLASGKSNREIAETLVVSVNTIERHLVTIYGKLGVQTRSAATAYAHQHGLD